jgi:hypothetical protein
MILVLRACVHVWFLFVCVVVGVAHRVSVVGVMCGGGGG